MAPALTKAEEEPDSSQVLLTGSASKHLRVHLSETLTDLIRRNLKNLLADSDCEISVYNNQVASSFSMPDVEGMKNVLGDCCDTIGSIMNCAESDSKEVEMGLHSANSTSLQQLLDNKKLLAGSQLSVSSPSPTSETRQNNLDEMIREFESVVQRAPAAINNGNGDIVSEDDDPMLNTLTNSVVSASVASVPSVAGTAAAEGTAAAAAVTNSGECVLARQAELERRCSVLLHRLRVLQTRSFRRQSSAQVNQLLEQLNATRAALPSTSPAAPTSSPNPPPSQPPPTTDITEVLRSPDAKNYSTTQLVNLVLNNRSAATAAAANATVSETNSGASVAVRRVDPELALAVTEATAHARCRLTRLIEAHDSDATESSSGGESGDEFDEGWDDYSQEHSVPIRQRALWRWMKDRASVASRWSWLSAQVTDLEFRIRQLNDLNRQLRAHRRKTDARAEPASDKDSGSAPTPPAEIGGAGDASSQPLPADVEKSGQAEDGDGAGPDHCSRTRPVAPVPRRRYFRSRLAARRLGHGVVTRCGCDPGAAGCVVCGGRAGGAAPSPPSETQPARCRLARLQPTFHPVLSFSQQAPLAHGYSSLLRRGRLQRSRHLQRQRSLRLTSGGGAPVTSSAPPAVSGTPAPAGLYPHHQADRQHQQLLKRKLGELGRFSVVDGREARLGRSGSGKKRRASSASAASADIGLTLLPMEQLRQLREHSSGRLQQLSSAPRPDDTPTSTGSGSGSSSGQSSARHSPSPVRREPRPERPERPERSARHRQNSYDIDNIVIPASMAATTKIEKLKYKEIITPAWREVDPVTSGASLGTVNGTATDQEAGDVPIETLDDCEFERRHQPAELAERRRLYQSLNPAASHRGPGHPRRPDAPDTPLLSPGSAGLAFTAAGPVSPAPADEPLPPPHPRPPLRVTRQNSQPYGYERRWFPLSDRRYKEMVREDEVFAHALSQQRPSPRRSPSPTPTDVSTESAAEPEPGPGPEIQ